MKVSHSFFASSQNHKELWSELHHSSTCIVMKKNLCIYKRSHGKTWFSALVQTEWISIIFSTNKETPIIYSLFRSIVLDYDITINKLRENDRIFEGGSLGNFSLAGFEMILHRHVSHYIINYYLPSGLFVVVSWISFLVPADIIPGLIFILYTIHPILPTV